MNSFEPNEEEVLGGSIGEIQWVRQHTAILIIHGIGNQLPLETIDSFGRGLLLQYKKQFGAAITISHRIVEKKDSRKGDWFDNVLRIEKSGEKTHIDLYEYYWANYTEDKSSWLDIDRWIQGVVKGAKTFYSRNARMGEQYKDKSIFFNSRTGSFRPGFYWGVLSITSKVVLLFDLLYRGILNVISVIPLLGSIADSMVKSYSDNIVNQVTNVLGDVVVYNVSDPKSKFYDVKKRIQEGAVKALTFLVEKTTHGGKSLEYGSILVAGHSLGSQVAYDALNRLNLQVNRGLISVFKEDGSCKLKTHKDLHISKLVNGFITFGSPLDKIIFFLRENIPNDQFLRQQLLDHFNGFKQRDLSQANQSTTERNFEPLHNGLRRLLESIKWRNYYDGHDYVSGGLDYYGGLSNVDCRFNSRWSSFTHSHYWSYEPFYRDIIIHFLS